MSRQTLKICEYNVENLFISMEYYDGQDLDRIQESDWRQLALAQLREKQKPINKVRGVARALLDVDPDVAMLVEVGGRESLENFNTHFLGDRFVPYFVQGNSRRSIDLGFLVKKDVGFRVEAISNRDTPIEVYSMRMGKYSGKFSRDMAELRLHDESGPRLIFVLVHLKSKLGTELDVDGKDLRTAEAIALASHYEKLRLELPGVPVIVSGDFNASINSLELELLRRTELVDFHDVLKTPDDERATYIHFEYSGKSRPNVLDYILLCPELAERVVREESRTYRYKGLYDIPDEWPATWLERQSMASDHYPLVVTLDITRARE